MNLELRDTGLFVTVRVRGGGGELDVADVLVDTGSATTIFATDALSGLGVVPKPSDILRRIRGVGGVEHVFSRRMERVSLGAHGIEGFEIEIGGMDYGFAMNGILGLDFLLRTGAVLNLRKLSIEFDATP